MSNQLPITIQCSALPPQVRWTPQQLADGIAQRLTLVTAQSFALFVSGATAPLTNVGPWFNTNTNSWWVWSNTAGAYVPEPIPYPGNYPARATPSVVQSVDVDNAKHLLNFPTIIINEGTVYEASKYTAPVDGVYAVGCNLQVDNDDAVAALLDLQLQVWKNGTTFLTGAGNAAASPPGSRWYPNLGYQLVQLDAGDYIEMYLQMQDGTNTGAVDVSTNSYFNVNLVQEL